MSNELNECRIIAGVGIEEISDFLGITYIDTAKIFNNSIQCPINIKKKIKIFLLKNYTKRIEEL